MLSRLIARATLLATALSSAHVSHAHHSQSAFSDELTEFVGVLSDVRWINPHVILTLDVADAGESAGRWTFEIDSIYMLLRSGVSRELLPVGQEIRLAGYRSNTDPREALGMNMLLPDGREALLLGRARPLWTDDVLGLPVGATSNNTVVANTAAENRGIFRVWSSPRPAERAMHLPFRETAVAARSTFDLMDNFATRCEPEGLPRLLRNPHPFEFVDRGAEILMRSQLYDLVRTIRMNETAVPDDAPASPLGYSIGRWDDGVLVVETSRINWPYFDNIGTPQSENVALIERYTLSDDQSRLDYHVTVTDPATFTEDATIAGYWLALGEPILRYECLAD
jgi:hypothetical protein